jgi:hypothetical protein
MTSTCATRISRDVPDLAPVFNVFSDLQLVSVGTGYAHRPADLIQVVLAARGRAASEAHFA